MSIIFLPRSINAVWPRLSLTVTSMLIPSSFYGRYKAVLTRSRASLRHLARGGQWNEAIGAEHAVDTANCPGLIVLHGPSRLLGDSSHFHCYVHLQQILDALSDGGLPAAVQPEIFHRSLQTAWGVLGLLSQPNVMWLHPKERHEPFLKACLQYWDVLLQEGERYSNGSTTGQGLWAMHTNLKYVLANSGFSIELLNAPLPAGGLADLLRRGGFDFSGASYEPAPDRS